MTRVFTAFSGYDSQCLALDRLGVNYDLVGWSEIDNYAIQAHNLLFPQYAERNFGDICAIDWSAVPDFDLFTYSFPCTNISNAGLQEGFAEGSGTASSLLWECRKAIIAKRPKYLVMENVKALVNKKNRPYFLKWQAELESYGYTNFAQVLNAKHYGVAQNRERVFMVSILGDAWERNNVVSVTDRIRRLTPRECFRLMDVSDEDFDKLIGISDTQLYKMAGNSIVIACLVAIFKNLIHLINLQYELDNTLTA